MANRIVGLRNIHIAKMTSPGVYASPVKLEGAKAFNTTNEVSENAFYSDDVMDFYSKNVTSMEIEIELAYLTPELESLITGKKYVNGALVSSSTDATQEFAIMYEMTTLKEPIRRVIYDCTLSRDERNAASKSDSLEEQVVTLSGKAKPDKDGNFDAILDKNHVPLEDDGEFAAIWDEFFTEVQTIEKIEEAGQ